MMQDAILTCAHKLIRVSLIYHTEPTTKKWKTEKNKKQKNRYAQVYRYTVHGICRISSEEEKEGYSGNNLQKRMVGSVK